MTLSLDISHLKNSYEAGKLTPEKVIAEIYERIRAKGAEPDWISLVDERMALERARSAPRGALYGIPFAVKDNIDVAGLPTTCACPAFAYIPDRSAAVVERLEAAGAIVIGKTNLDQFATGLVGTRSPYGIPASTFNPEYISGGSSSGSAVAVAGGQVSFALGTDTAGSGRIPAGFNNIVGLKPTKGIISTRGVVPACRTQDTVSIFALTVADATTVASIASAYDAEDPYARRCDPAFCVEAIPPSWRVGIPKGDLEFFGDTEYAELYGKAIERISALGAQIVEIDFSPFREAAALLYAGPWVAERLAAVGPLAIHQPEAIYDVVRSIIMGAQEKSAVSAFEGFYRLAELVRAADAEWAKMDVMLLPTAPTTYKISDLLRNPIALNTNLGTYTNFVNLMDLSGLAIPAGFRNDGIPFGVTLLGRAFADGQLASIGDALHRTLRDARLGATTFKLVDTPPTDANKDTGRSIKLAVVGAHLSGLPLNWQLTERHAVFRETTRTAKGYRLYELPGTTPPKPGLIFDNAGPGGLEVEIWEMDYAAFGTFVALIPPPLCIGTITLEDGRQVKGFLCEAHAKHGARDVTGYGGWRAWVQRTAIA